MIEPTYVYKAIVVKIVDADTVDIMVDLGFLTSTKVRIRLFGIDAPELRTDEGKRAKAALLEKMPLGSKIIAKTFKIPGDKYGRWLGKLFVEGVDVSEWLVENKLAMREFT